MERRGECNESDPNETRDTSAQWHLRIFDLRNFLSFIVAFTYSLLVFLSPTLPPPKLSSLAPFPV